MISVDEIKEYFENGVLVNNLIKTELEIGSDIEYYYFSLEMSSSGSQFYIVSKNKEIDEYASIIYENLPSFSGNNLLKVSMNKSLEYPFDSLLFVPPHYHHLFEDDFDEEREDLIQLIPIFNCEFSGEETIEEFQELSWRYVKINNLARQASPKIKISMNNPKTNVKTGKEKFVLVSYTSLIVYIRDILGVDSAFLNLINYKDELIKVTSLTEDSYLIELNANQIVISAEEINDYVYSWVSST